MNIEGFIHGDCRLNIVPNFDVMIADPPYSEHVHANATSQSPGRGTRFRDLGFDFLSPELRNSISSYAARAKRWSLVYSDVEGHGDWRESMKSARATYIRPLAWVRWSMPQLSGDRPPTGFEILTCYWGSDRGRKSWNGPGSLTHLSHKCLRGEGKHKAEKPLDQLLDLVTWFTNPGETICDPVAGSGTTGLACRLLGRKFVGCEFDQEWYEKAKRRILETKLSERDEERFRRWTEGQEVAKVEEAKRDANTAKVRAKLDAKKLMETHE